MGNFHMSNVWTDSTYVRHMKIKTTWNIHWNNGSYNGIFFALIDKFLEISVYRSRKTFKE